MTWLNAGAIPVPQRADYPTMADYMLAYGVHSSLMNADLNFLAATPDAEFASPKAYMDSLVAYAQSLLQNHFPVPYAPPDWDPVAAGKAAAMKCFDLLNQLPVNAGDPATVSVFMAWVTGTGQLYGGHV